MLHFNKFMLLWIFPNVLIVHGFGEKMIHISEQPVNVVDEKFVSFGIDPVVLFNDIADRGHIFHYLKSLPPSYLRTCIPLNKIGFVDNKNGSVISSKSFVITSNHWDILHQNMKLSNSAVICALDNFQMQRNVFNPIDSMSLLQYTYKMSQPCLWEIDAGSGKMQEYIYQVEGFRGIINTMFKNNPGWDIIGGNVAKLLARNNDTNSNYFKQRLNSLTKAITYNISDTPSSEFSNWNVQLDGIENLWALTPSNVDPISFKDGQVWATLLGQTALSGYKVLFRQLQKVELEHCSASFWVSALHKLLMGKEVLKVSKLYFDEDLDVFAHSTKNCENSSISIMVINRSGAKKHIFPIFGINNSEGKEIYEYSLTANKIRTLPIFSNERNSTYDFPNVTSELDNMKRRVTESLAVDGNSITFVTVPKILVSYSNCFYQSIDSIMNRGAVSNTVMPSHCNRISSEVERTFRGIAEHERLHKRQIDAEKTIDVVWKCIQNLEEMFEMEGVSSTTEITYDIDPRFRAASDQESETPAEQTTKKIEKSEKNSNDILLKENNDSELREFRAAKFEGEEMLSESQSDETAIYFPRNYDYSDYSEKQIKWENPFLQIPIHQTRLEERRRNNRIRKDSAPQIESVDSSNWPAIGEVVFIDLKRPKRKTDSSPEYLSNFINKEESHEDMWDNSVPSVEIEQATPQKQVPSGQGISTDGPPKETTAPAMAVTETSDQNVENHATQDIPAAMISILNNTTSPPIKNGSMKNLTWSHMEPRSEPHKVDDDGIFKKIARSVTKITQSIATVVRNSVQTIRKAMGASDYST